MCGMGFFLFHVPNARKLRVKVDESFDENLHDDY